MGFPVVHFEVCTAGDEPLAGFYSTLFGWELRGVPGSDYLMIDTRGGTGINGGIRAGDPAGPWCAFYVEAADPQATLERAVELGGSVAVPVTSFSAPGGGAGRRAVLADPDGLLVGLLGAPAEAGAPAIAAPTAGAGEPATWFEVMGCDAARSRQFYAELFGWQVDDSFPGYATADTRAGRGIVGGIGGGTPARWATVYAKVPDLDAALGRAAELGGSPVTDPAVPALKNQARAALYGDAGTMATGAFRDPAGNVFGVFQY